MTYVYDALISAGVTILVLVVAGYLVARAVIARAPTLVAGAIGTALVAGRKPSSSPPLSPRGSRVPAGDDEPVVGAT
jgi:hypothetical protein